MKNIQQLFVSFIAIATLMIACTAQKEKEQSKPETLKAKVIAVHDTAMAKMEQIMSLQNELKQAKSDTLDSMSTANINRAIADLSVAHEDMMVWMREFSTNFPDGTLMGHDHTGHHEGHGDSNEQIDHAAEEETYHALGQELVKIQKVGDDMDKSIINAIELLGKKE